MHLVIGKQTLSKQRHNKDEYNSGIGILDPGWAGVYLSSDELVC